MGQLKFGWLRGTKLSVSLPMGASEVINNLSGKFVTMDANGRGEITDDGDEDLFGWVESAAGTTDAAEGGTTLNCIIDLNAVFRLPTTGATLIQSMIGKTFDLDIVSDIQSVDLSASTHKHVIIVGGDLVDNVFVDVRINPNEIIAA